MSFALTDNSISDTDIVKLITKIDSAYDFAQLLTGFEPKENSNASTDKLTYAQVTQTCGTGCGYLGVKGIEIESDFFRDALRDFSKNKQINHLFFYEMGRNFFPYSNKLEININRESHIISTGIAIYIQYKIVSALKFKCSSVNAIPFKLYQETLADLANNTKYLTKNSLLDELIYGQKTDLLNNWSISDLVASILLKMESMTKQDAFLLNFYNGCKTLKDSASIQDSLDHFVIACSLATRANQIKYFTDIGWPVSERVKKHINATY